MGKNKGFDVVADAQERAEHNMNPYYWFNRVTPYTVAQWKVGKLLSPLFFLMYSLIGVAMLTSFNAGAEEQNKTLLSLLFNFGDSATRTSSAGMIMFCFMWAISAIGSVQVLMQWVYDRRHPQIKPKPRKEKKRKHPKRPKNWA